MEMKNKEMHRITSTAIIRKDGKYLVTKRSPHKKSFPNKWTVPGGGLEVDDYMSLPKTTSTTWYFAVEKSLRREIKEETNLEVGKIKYICDMVFIRPDGIPVVVLSFYCDYKSGEVKLDEDNVEYAWVTLEEAKNYALIEGILEEIEMIEDIYQGKEPSEENLRKGNNE